MVNPFNLSRNIVDVGNILLKASVLRKRLAMTGIMDRVKERELSRVVQVDLILKTNQQHI